MLALINDRLTRKVFDDVMEVAWSTMWNVTDETPRNCKRFLDGHGMNYFLGCLNVNDIKCANRVEGTNISNFLRNCSVFPRKRSCLEI